MLSGAVLSVIIQDTTTPLLRVTFFLFFVMSMGGSFSFLGLSGGSCFCFEETCRRGKKKDTLHSVVCSMASLKLVNDDHTKNHQWCEM